MSTTSRGYGWQHVQARQRMARTVEAGGAVCTRCRRIIVPGSLWDLDHTDDRTGYAGPAHRACNRAAGARKTNRMRKLKGMASTWGW